MASQQSPWELTILDALPDHAQDLGSLAIGDIDADGHIRWRVAGGACEGNSSLRDPALTRR